MEIEERLNIYRSDYLFHIDFKEKIYARMMFFTVFITACITANFSMQNEISKLGCFQQSLLLLCWVIGAIILIFAIYSFYCITNLKSDEWVNSNSEMETYRQTLRQHYINYNSNATEDEINTYVSQQFSIYLTEQYMKCSTILYENNIFRQKCLARFAVSTYLLLAITFIVSLVFMYQKMQG